MDQETPFNRMVDSGKRLVEAQQRENGIGRLYSKHGTQEQLEKWKAARRIVDKLAEEYFANIRAWRDSIEIEI